MTAPESPYRTPRVAIAHDYVTQRGGAERVVLALLRAFPGATLHTTFYDPGGTYPEFADYPIVTSGLNRIGPLRHDPRLALPLLAPVVSRMHIDADVVIASSSGWAHGIATSGASVVYCHAPARWLYQRENYLGGPAWRSPVGWALAALTPALHRWDQRAAERADLYVCSSRVVRDRIQDAYGIDAEIVPAPHGLDPSGEHAPVAELDDWRTRGYHLIVSRLRPYKNVGATVEAFAGLPQERLVVVGQGPHRDELVAKAPSNVRVLSDLTDPQLRWVYDHSTALIGPSFEDYGLTTLEAASFGKPTIALQEGGYLDTVIAGATGVFVPRPTPEDLREGVREAATTAWDPEKIRTHAREYDDAHFITQLQTVVERKLAIQFY